MAGQAQQRIGRRFFMILMVLGGALGLILAPDSARGVRSVTDLLGRRVGIPDEPRRVVALAPSITEIVYALEQESRLAGVTRFSDYPAAAARLPKVGSYVHLDLERIVALRPDLCIAVKDGNPKVVIDRLMQLNIPVFAVNPTNLETVIQAVEHIGRLLNTEQKAALIAADMRTRIERVRQQVADVEHRPRVFFQIGLAPIVSVGSATFIHELIETAGGENVARGDVPYPRFSREQVIGLAPDVIIITSMARSAIFEQVKAEWARWKHIPAARNNRIIVQESNLFDRPSPRLVQGLELLVQLIHPQLFGGSP